MSSIDYGRPKYVPSARRLNGGDALPPLRHGGTRLGPISVLGKSRKNLVRCKHCNKQVTEAEIEKHYRKCKVAIRYFKEKSTATSNKMPCPLCGKKVASIKDHVKDKHGHHLTSRGELVPIDSLRPRTDQ